MIFLKNYMNLWPVVLLKIFCKNSKIIIQPFEGIFLNLENTLGM